MKKTDAIRSAVFAAALLAGGTALAEPAKSAFDISANIRLRAEAIDGQFRPGKAESDFLFSTRTTIFAEYDGGPVRVGGELLDARGYGEKKTSSVSTSEVNALEPLQAYFAADFADLLGHGNSGLFKVGRFVMDIGSTRLVARSDSANAPQAYTGAVLDLVRPDKDRIVAFWTMPNLRLPADAASLQDNDVKWDRSTSDLVFYGGSYTRAKLAPGISADAYFYRLEEGDAPGYPTRNRHLSTYGLRLVRKPGTGPFDFDLEAARQTGSIRATAAANDLNAIPVRAAFAHAELGKKLSGGWSPRFSAMFDYGSGDHQGAGRYGRFDPLFGSRRFDLGYTGLYGPLNWSNLVSAGLRVEGKPNKDLDFFVAWRANWLDSATDSFGSTGVRDAKGRSGNFAGHQLETRIRQQLVKDRLKLELGGDWFAKGRFLDTAPNAPKSGDTVYGYAALTASF